MAGGDGSQALVASIAIEHDLPFVCVSAGTRNHFALDLGIDREDPRAASTPSATRSNGASTTRPVGDRLFVNNVSLGIYATIVQQEGYRDAKAETTKALLPEMLGRTEEPFDLQFTEPDGTEVDGAYLIQVSNNPYVLGRHARRVAASPPRHRHARGRGRHRHHGRRGGRGGGHVRARPAPSQPPLARVHHRPLRGPLALGQGLSPASTARRSSSTPRSSSGSTRSDSASSSPEGNLTAAERRRARDVSMGDLIAIARGIDPLEARSATATARGSCPDVPPAS